MKNVIINPKGVVRWLVENTSLTFEQIADFCDLHIMIVESIADGDENVVLFDPITSHQLTREEIERCEKSEHESLRFAEDPTVGLKIKRRKIAKFKSLSQRRIMPDAIFWLLTFYPEITNQKIMKLIGATNSAIEKIKDGSYKNIKSLSLKDPVLTGLCTKRDFEETVKDLKKSEDVK